jgi:transposase-like protein
MHSLTLYLDHEDLASLESVIDQITVPDIEWTNFWIDTGFKCPACDVHEMIIGTHDCDGWRYTCEHCDLEFEYDYENKEMIPLEDD